MPTAGRSRLPHNNRVSTSHALKTSDIWSKTIGHDPYASQTGEDGMSSGDYGSNAEKARGLLELARHQNLTGGRSGGGDAGGDDFARKMFLGLKGGKKRLGGVGGAGVGVDAIHARALLEVESSSSEEEFIQTAPTSAGECKTKAADGGVEGDSSSIDSSSSSSSDERERRKKRRRHKEMKRSKSSDHRRKKKSSKHRKHSSSRKRDRSLSSSEDESSGDDASSTSNHRRHKSRRHHQKHKRGRGHHREGGKDDRKRD